jgi:hypothetical protein
MASLKSSSAAATNKNVPSKLDVHVGDAVKPGLYLVQPGSISRSEVYVESRPCSEPALDSRMLVGRVVVCDHSKPFAGERFAV